MKSNKSNKALLVVLVVLTLSLVGCGSGEEFYYGSANKAEAGFEGTDVSNTVSDPSEMGVGDVMFFKFGGANGNVEVDFSSVDSNASFYLGVASISEKPGMQNAVIMDQNLPVGDSETKGVDKFAWLRNADPEEEFNAKLREEEFNLSLSEDMQPAENTDFNSSAKAVYATHASTYETFRVLSSITSMSSYKEVDASLYYEGDNVKCYVDAEVADVNPEDLTEDDARGLCEKYNLHVEFIREVFGREPDVNGDGKVSVLMTPQVNRLGGMAGGVITGFFFAKDQYARTAANLLSNQQEIVYMLVPDSRGKYGTVIPKEFALYNYMSGVFVHELQHLANFDLHVNKYKSEAEIGWLNEGLSHLVEDLVGYGQENPSRTQLFLDAPEYYSAMGGDSPGLADRGASYLFLRYLYEQHPDGNAFLNALANTDLTGTENLVNAFGGAVEGISGLGDMFNHWMAALLMTDSGLTADQRYIYEQRKFDYDTGRWQGACVHCTAQDNRGTVLDGVSLETYGQGSQAYLESGAVKFFDLASPAKALQFYGGTNGDFSAVLVRNN